MATRLIACVFLILFGVTELAAQKTSTGNSEQTVKVSYCELKKDPTAYNHKLIEVTAFITHGFEDFGLLDPSCPGYPDVWLEYGGTVKSGTKYCCGVTTDRTRPAPLIVENIRIELNADGYFRQLDRILGRRPDSVTRATLVGRFFSGNGRGVAGGSRGGGYGHMGCCSLLAIQQVLWVEPQNSRVLDYVSSADQPDIDGVGCGYTDLTDLEPYETALKAQAEADAGTRDWTFTDPRTVATERLAELIEVDRSSIRLRQTRRSQGRVIYEWRPRGKKTTYMVVVSRPYWLSYYSKDPKRVAWVVLAAYDASCEGGHAVERIK